MARYLIELGVVREFVRRNVSETAESCVLADSEVSVEGVVRSLLG